MKTNRSKENVVYFLPNLFTTANLFCGFYSMIASLQDFYLRAAFAILIAGIFDVLDGRVARMTHASSKFGIEYDSLADLISFGLAPAMLVYLWSIESFGRIGWLACFVFMACGALRLARFNTKTTSMEKSYFEGLPIPMAAYTMVTTTLLFHELMLDENKSYFNLFLTITLGILMVSNIKYRSFKDLDFKSHRSFGILVMVVFLLIIIAYNPSIMMFIMMIGYVASGPLIHFFGPKRLALRRKKTEEIPMLRLIEKEDS